METPGHFRGGADSKTWEWRVYSSFGAGTFPLAPYSLHRRYRRYRSLSAQTFRLPSGDKAAVRRWAPSSSCRFAERAGWSPALAAECRACCGLCVCPHPPGVVWAMACQASKAGAKPNEAPGKEPKKGAPKTGGEALLQGHLSAPVERTGMHRRTWGHSNPCEDIMDRWSFYENDWTLTEVFLSLRFVGHGAAFRQAKLLRNYLRGFPA